MAPPVYLPAWRYAKEKGVSLQNVYRWVREKKFADEDCKTIEKVVKRIVIRESAEPKLYAR